MGELLLLELQTLSQTILYSYSSNGLTSGNKVKSLFQTNATEHLLLMLNIELKSCRHEFVEVLCFIAPVLGTASFLFNCIHLVLSLAGLISASMIGVNSSSSVCPGLKMKLTVNIIHHRHEQYISLCLGAYE